jgi:hypothetical protein
LFFQYYCFLRTFCNLLQNQNKALRVSSLLKNPMLRRSNNRWRSAWKMALQLVEPSVVRCEIGARRSDAAMALKIHVLAQNEAAPRDG